MFQLSDNGHILVPTTFPEHRSFSKQCRCLQICNDVRYCQGILWGKEIPGDCPNHKWSNLCWCLVHFLQVALPGIGTFVILPASFYVLLIPSYYNVYQDSFMVCSCVQLWCQDDCFPSTCQSRWLYSQWASLAHSQLVIITYLF